MSSSRIILTCIVLSILLLHFTKASSLAAPPQSAVVVAFEDVYDLSLLANTISDLGIDTTLVIPHDANDYYEYLVAVEVIKINASLLSSDNKDTRALKLCESFISDFNITKYFQAQQPTFVIFPGVR